MMTIKLKPMRNGYVLPIKKHTNDAGYDLAAPEDDMIGPFETKKINMGYAIQLDDGYWAAIVSRSGLAKNYITVANSPGIIDSGYRGEIGVLLHNSDDVPFQIKKGDRIAQMIVHRVCEAEIQEVQELSNSDRGAGGFGSSGV